MKVLVVVDMQNDFIDGALGTPEAYDGKLYTDYTAFQSCLKRIKLTVPAGETIAMPFKIGCGLGGGDWNVILGLIQKELSDKYTVELWRKEV